MTTPDARPPGRRSRARLWLTVATALFAAALPYQNGSHASTDKTWKPSFFHTLEYRYSGLKPFPKWTGALERYFDERATKQGGCDEAELNECHYRTWKAFLSAVRDVPADMQLSRVNDFMNRHRYIVDPINWGVLDYWESPNQFFSKYGDCEDYAIAKFLSLRRLGWESNDMRIVVLQDGNLNLPHAVLVVRHDGKNLVLDNQLTIVTEARRIRHYQPIFSVNEESWWRHRPARN
jgi:predicted transglutaminase-like cysteine proteinase